MWTVVSGISSDVCLASLSLTRQTSDEIPLSIRRFTFVLHDDDSRKKHRNRSHRLTGNASRICVTNGRRKVRPSRRTSNTISTQNTQYGRHSHDWLWCCCFLPAAGASQPVTWSHKIPPAVFAGRAGRRALAHSTFPATTQKMLCRGTWRNWRFGGPRGAHPPSTRLKFDHAISSLMSINTFTVS